MKKVVFTFAGLALSAMVFANTPAAPAASEAAKAKAAEEAKAKAAHTAKVDAYKVCLAMDRAAANYRKNVANAKPPTPTPPCSNPGPFVSPATVASAPVKR